MKRNKRYNPVKYRQVKGVQLMRGVCIARREDVEKATCYNLDGSLHPVEYKQADLMTSIRAEWDLMVCVIGRRQDGQEYIKTELLSTQASYYNQALTETYYAKAEEMKKNFNPVHYVTTGWIVGLKNSLDNVDVNRIML